MIKDYDFVFKGASFDETYFDDENPQNDNIEFEISDNLKINDILKSKESVTFDITFKYVDGIDLNEQINSLKSSLIFNFVDKNLYLNGAEPVIDYYGMIPVLISNNGVVTTVSENDPNWYNYNEKQWANAILVKQSGVNSRNYYLNNPGVEVKKTDILAYYVWVSRFSYKIWNSITSNDTEPNNIEIIFHGIDTIYKGTSVGDYLTHPAFWWNVDSDQVRDEGEEIPDFWVGKFETSQGQLQLQEVVIL